MSAVLLCRSAESLQTRVWVLPIVEARPIFMEPRGSASRLSAADAFEG
jgi:hypothetical protein